MAFDDDDMEVPPVAAIMVKTRNLNHWLGTAYTLEDVAGMDELVFSLLYTMQQAFDPPTKGG